MKIKIYQINPDRDIDRIRFTNLENTLKYLNASKVDSSMYDRVFVGDVDCNHLESVFMLFNVQGHRLHRGSSLSISDVVEVDDGENPEFYFCDSIGFQSIEFQPEQAHADEDLIRVLVVEPHRAPYESEIKNTLKGEQRAVEGLIQYIRNDDGTIIVVNDEGKINGMEGNRRIDGDVLVGPFFVAGDTGDNLCSLTDEQLAKYAEKFAEPEDISPEEIESHTGFTLYTF